MNFGDVQSEHMRNKNLLIGAAIFVLAITVRLIYLYEISKGELFGTPVIDSATYLDIAKNISSTGSLDPRIFWQSFIYPLYLASIISLFDGHLLIARIIQLIAGSVSAVLIYNLGKKLFDVRIGIIASVITALYGPLFFFEAELLATGWAAFISVVVVYLMTESIDKRKTSLYLLAGLASGLAVMIRVTFLPFIFLAILSMFFHGVKNVAGRKSFVAGILVMFAVFVSVLTVPALLSKSVTGNFSAIPKSGSLNLYIGNNPDTDRTIMIRPGYQWRNLIREPLVCGYSTDAEHRRYFRKRFTDYLATDPAGYAAGILKKTVQFLSSRELPRNIDIYTGRKWSGLLSCAVWKWKMFGFPFGILLPFAVLGIFYRRKNIPSPLLMFLLIYPLSIIAVFVSSRYRVVMIPLTTIVAAAGVMHMIDRVKNGDWTKTGRDSTVIVAIVVLSSVFGPFTAESYDYEAELYASAGYEQGKAGEIDEAEKNLRKSLSLSPDYYAGHRILGNLLNQKGEFREAEEHFRRVLKDDPGSYTVQYYLGLSLWKQGRTDEAMSFLESAEKGAIKAREETIYKQIQDIKMSILKEEGTDDEYPEQLD
ncbi:MAG: glycosyltransferase family 39 protein [Candidatus Krumholzibacteriota bacterium]|nr:glycosyltransferase family 39 protein [Candidatus Krumholzibacteriota bacterium]